MSDNYYQLLGVSEQATKDEIKKAYRGLQMKYHPDKNANSPESVHMTQKINEAYETLSDDHKKQEYDMLRSGHGMRSFRSAPGMPPMGDIFDVLFGGGGGGGGNPFASMGPGSNPFATMGPGGNIHIFHGGNPAFNKPAPITKALSITMEQVFHGASLPVEIERWIVQNNVKVVEKETIYVDIPQGIDEREMIVLRDRGNVVSETCKGDVKLTVMVQNNTAFKRVGLDLILDKTIQLKEALCGFNFELNYINGKSYTLNNNKGSIVPSEYKKIYPGMGLKRGEHKGNMIIHFHVEFPTVLTTEQIDQLSAIL